MTENICPTCGSNIKEDARYCPACGGSLSGKPVSGKKAGSGQRNSVLFLVLTIIIFAGGFTIVSYMNSSQKTVSHPYVPGMTGDSPPTSEEMLASLPDDYNELVLLGNDYMDRSVNSLAIECYRRALAIDSTNPDVFTDLGACFYAVNMSDDAIAVLKKALSLDPNHLIANFNLGVIFKGINEFDSTEKYWTRYLELYPDSPVADTLRTIIEGL